MVSRSTLRIGPSSTSAGSVAGEAECRLGTTRIRLGRDGERLAGFGAGGVRELRGLNLDLIQPSGATILSERRGQALILLRLKFEGERDLGFGGNGSARVALPAGFHVRPVATDEKGRILLAGFYNSENAVPQAAGRDPPLEAGSLSPAR